MYSSYVKLFNADDDIDSDDAMIAHCQEEEDNINLAIAASLTDSNK